jgi:hypothetical protein
MLCYSFNIFFIRHLLTIFSPSGRCLQIGTRPRLYHSLPSLVSFDFSCFYIWKWYFSSLEELWLLKLSLVAWNIGIKREIWSRLYKQIQSRPFARLPYNCCKKQTYLTQIVPLNASNILIYIFVWSWRGGGGGIKTRDEERIGKSEIHFIFARKYAYIFTC